MCYSCITAIRQIPACAYAAGRRIPPKCASIRARLPADDRRDTSSDNEARHARGRRRHPPGNQPFVPRPLLRRASPSAHSGEWCSFRDSCPQTGRALFASTGGVPSADAEFSSPGCFSGHRLQSHFGGACAPSAASRHDRRENSHALPMFDWGNRADGMASGANTGMRLE